LFSSLSRELRLSFDADGRFCAVEGGWQSVLGWRPERLRGWCWDEIVHPADWSRFGAALEMVHDGEGECDVEVRLAHATGGYRAIEWTLLRGSGVHRILGRGQERSVPRRRETTRSYDRALEAELAECQRRLAAMEAFAGMAAHQLAEPLIIAESSAILIAEELEEELGPVARARLDAIGRGAARARRLMDALLQDARSSTQAPALTTVDLARVVDETISAYEPRIEAQGTAVRVDPLPAVLADAKLLAVVFDNLVSNALKHGPREGGVTKIGATPVDGGWRVSVTSSGPPIPASDVEKIFESYVRLPGERRISGTGLGLSICRRLVERLGGTLGVDPGTTDGNTFWLVLPAVPESPST
jgi:signal transduction histidine kinase